MNSQDENNEKSDNSTVIEDLTLEQEKSENVNGGKGASSKEIQLESLSFG